MEDHGVEHNMITEELKQRLTPHIKEQLQEEDYPKVEGMLKECYRLLEDGEPIIVVSNKPFGNYDLTMKFHEETGEFLGPEQMSYAREYGELL